MARLINPSAAPDSAAPSSLPMLAVVIAVCMWAIGSVFVKLADIDGVSFSFYRLWLGALVTILILAAVRQPLSAGISQAIPAGLLFGINVVFFFSAIRQTSIANANLIAAIQPAVVLLVAGPLFAERIGRREVGWTALAIAGVAVVIVGSAGSPAWSPFGDLLAVGAVLTFTAYFLVSKHLRATLATVEYFAVVQLAAAIVVTPIALFQPGSLQAPAGLDWLYLSIVIIFTGVGGHLLVNWAHPYVDVSVSSLIMLAAPVVAAAAAWIVLDEHLGIWQLVGGCITLVAMVAFVTRAESRRTTRIVDVHEPATLDP